MSVYSVLCLKDLQTYPIVIKAKTKTKTKNNVVVSLAR